MRSADDDRFTDILEARGHIGTAIGVTMVERDLTPDQALGHLVETSRNTNTKLRDLAVAVISNASPGPGSSRLS